MGERKINVLIIEDNQDYSNHLRTLFDEINTFSFNLFYSINIISGIELLKNKIIDIALLNLKLIETNELEFSSLKMRFHDLSLIILCDQDKENLAIELLRNGAHDYLIKDHITSPLLGKAIIYSIERKNTENILMKYQKKIDDFNDLKIINKTLRHDILNHLATLSMGLELYQHKKDEKYLESSFKSINKAIELIRQMKELESIISDDSEITPVDIKQVIDKVMASMNVAYSVEGNCQIYASKTINSVIGNIVGNAIKHGNTKKIDFKILSNGNRCEIFISDYGRGIPDEIKGRVFEEGFSHGESKGSGIGLYIVKKVVERYGGTIKLKDSKPQGTTFVISLKKAN